MSDRVLVALDREEAAALSEWGSEKCPCPACRVKPALRAALDTDRETLARKLAEELDPSGWRLLDASDRDMATAEVEAVLALLENGGEA